MWSTFNKGLLLRSYIDRPQRECYHQHIKIIGRENWMTLDSLKVGTSAVITAVGGDGALRCRLLDMGLIPHTRVTLQKVAPMGDPIEIRVRGYELTLRVEEAQKIEVEGELK